MQRPTAQPSYAKGYILAAIFVIGAVILYFSLFAVILVDDLFFERNWFLGNLPASAVDVLRVMYAPLIWLMERLDG